jgi:4-hydroxy-2-oxoheptanedioate aldolase
MMRQNILRELLRQEKPTVGTHIHSMWPGIVELIGHAGGFDYIEFTGDYAPYDLYDLDNFARTAELYHLSTMIKLMPEPRTFMAQRAVSSGIQSVMFADILTVEDAEDCVKALKTEPKGVNGVGLWRIVGYVFPGVQSDDYLRFLREDYAQYLNDIVIAIHIERKSAFEQLEAILSVEGIDMVQFGPSDFALSTGWSRAKVWEAQVKTIQTARKLGVRPRAECSVATMQKFIDLGVRDFCIGDDVGVLYRWWKTNGDDIRKTLANIE